MNGSMSTARAAGLLIAMLALDAAATSANAQYRYRYGARVYGYGPPVYGYSYGPAYYGYGPRYYGFRRSLDDPDSLPIGTGAWWRAMDRTNRGGNVGGSGSR
jgi:hypothetical protein